MLETYHDHKNNALGARCTAITHLDVDVCNHITDTVMAVMQLIAQGGVKYKVNNQHEGK